MSLYEIAGITVEMQPKYGTLSKQSEAYKITGDTSGINPLISLRLSDEFLTQKQAQNPHLTQDDCEYIWYGSEFYSMLPCFNGMLLHSSCVAIDGAAYLFSAPSGTGKSTHTQLWKRKFGEKLVFVNDDKPAIRIIDGVVYACGTPFSGKTDLNTNVCVPLKGICLLERGEENSIYRISSKEAIPKIMNQTIRPRTPQNMMCLLDVLDRILNDVPVYRLFCNISDEAACLSYETMSSEEK